MWDQISGILQTIHLKPQDEGTVFGFYESVPHENPD